MSLITHLETLITKHNKLEEEIRDAYNKYLPEEIVTLLKKQKLRLKEEIDLIRLKQQELVDSSA